MTNDFRFDQAEAVTPHDLEAERAVLGAILLNDQAFFDVADTVSARDFYRDAHKKIFEGMHAIASRGDKIDLITLVAFLRDTNTIDACGGPAYITALVDGMPRSSNVEAYARIVHSKALRAALISAGNAIIASAHETEDSREALDYAQRQVFGLSDRTQGQFIAPGELASKGMDIIEARMKNRGVPLGIPTGWLDLDAMFFGAKPGQFIIVAGRPSMGKTAFVLNWADHVARVQQKHVGFFSLEMDKEELALRWFSSVSGVHATKLQMGHVLDGDFEAISEAFVSMTGSRLFIDDTPECGAFDLRSKARKLQAQEGLDLIVVDYLQLMAMAKAENRNVQVATVSRALKLTARELKVPIIVLSQLSRDSAKKGERPSLADLRDSGALEQDADAVMFVHRPEYYEKTDENAGLAEIIIGKQRNGPIGTVRLQWQPESQRFTDRAW